jgi:hypothetical protein
MIEDRTKTIKHVERITKKYIIDFLNALLFSNTVLWDGDDQFNELPIFESSNEENMRLESRGALFVNKRVSRAVRVLVTVQESTRQRICYRIKGLNEPTKIDGGKHLFYPLENVAIDFSVCDLNLGLSDPASYSFSDNVAANGTPEASKMFTLLKYFLSATFVAIDDKDMFEDILTDILSQPPMPSDPHYKPVFGVNPHESSDHWDRP